MSRESAAPAVRPALLPAFLGAAACVAGLFVLGFDGYTIVRYVVAILALIVTVFAAQAGAWPWAVAAAVVAVLWNPVVPFGFDGVPWMAGHIVAATVLLAAGLFVKAPPSAAGPKRR